MTASGNWPFKAKVGRIVLILDVQVCVELNIEIEFAETANKKLLKLLGALHKSQQYGTQLLQLPLLCIIFKTATLFWKTTYRKSVQKVQWMPPVAITIFLI